MRKADYTLLAATIKRYATEAKLAALHGDDAQKIVSHWILATCDAIAVDFTRGSSVDKISFYRACSPD